MKSRHPEDSAEDRLKRIKSKLDEAVKEYCHHIRHLEKKHHKIDLSEQREKIHTACERTVSSIETCLTKKQGFRKVHTEIIGLNRLSLEMSISEHHERAIGRKEMHKLDDLHHTIRNKCAAAIGWVKIFEAEEKIKREL